MPSRDATRAGACAAVLLALPSLTMLLVIVSGSVASSNAAACTAIAAAGPASPVPTGSDADLDAGPDAGLDSEQRIVAQQIVTAVRAFPATANIPQAAVIALATARQESGLRNLTYGDRDSLGAFQQRPSQGWGTPVQIMDVAHATTTFLQHLILVPAWQTRPVTDAAADVQHPAAAYRDTYQQWVPLAQALTTVLWPQSDTLLPSTPSCLDGPAALASNPDASDAIARAQSWVEEHVAYSQTSEHTNRYGTYRQDCSGYVSMAWGLARSFTTYDLPTVAHPITKDELQAGDIILKPGHTLIFERWADTSHASYWAYEEQHPGTDAVHHVVPYPYWPGQGEFTPYRFNGPSGASQAGLHWLS